MRVYQFRHVGMFLQLLRLLLRVAAEICYHTSLWSFAPD